MTGSISTASMCLAPSASANRDVVAVPGSDDEDSVERRRVDVPVREGVERLEVEQGLDLVGGLVGDVVGRDGQRVAGFDASDDLGLGALGRHLVVGRPVVIRSGRLDPEHDHDHDEAEQLRSPPEQHDEQRGSDGAPDDRRQLQEGQHREHHDAADAPQDVEAVGLERLELHEGPGDALPDARHRRDGEHEEDRQLDPSGQRRHPERALQGPLVRQDDREQRDERNYRGQREGVNGNRSGE